MYVAYNNGNNEIINNGIYVAKYDYNQCAHQSMCICGVAEICGLT